MTAFDVVIGSVILLGAALGAWRGLLRQVVGALAVVAAVVVPFVLAGPVTRQLEGTLGAPYPVAFVACALGLAVLTYVGVRVVSFVPVRLLEAKMKQGLSRVLGLVNRIGGAVVGGAKLGAYCWVGLSVLAVVAARVQTKDEASRLDASAAYTLARKHNVFEPFLRDELATLDRVLDGIVAGKKRAGPAVEALAKDPRVQAIAKDAALRKAVSDGELSALARSPDVLALVFDADAMARLQTAVTEFAQAPGTLRDAAADAR